MRNLLKMISEGKDNIPTANYCQFTHKLALHKETKREELIKLRWHDCVQALHVLNMFSVSAKSTTTLPYVLQLLPRWQ